MCAQRQEAYMAPASPGESASLQACHNVASTARCALDPFPTRTRLVDALSYPRSGRPHTSQSVAPGAFSYVQCGHAIGPEADAPVDEPAVASDGPLWFSARRCAGTGSNPSSSIAAGLEAGGARTLVNCEHAQRTGHQSSPLFRCSSVSSMMVCQPPDCRSAFSADWSGRSCSVAT